MGSRSMLSDGCSRPLCEFKSRDYLPIHPMATGTTSIFDSTTRIPPASMFEAETEASLAKTTPASPSSTCIHGYPAAVPRVYRSAIIQTTTPQFRFWSFFLQALVAICYWLAARASNVAAVSRWHRMSPVVTFRDLSCWDALVYTSTLRRGDSI